MLINFSCFLRNSKTTFPVFISQYYIIWFFVILNVFVAHFQKLFNKMYCVPKTQLVGKQYPSFHNPPISRINAQGESSCCNPGYPEKCKQRKYRFGARCRSRRYKGDTNNINILQDSKYTR